MSYIIIITNCNKVKQICNTKQPSEHTLKYQGDIVKPLIADLPYPNIDELTTDVTSGQIISFAYATQKGELQATLQYFSHHLYLEKDDADTLMCIAIAEMHHLDILGKTMLKLGAKPLLVQYPNSKMYYNTSTVSTATVPSKLLMDDIEGELNAIADYQKMLFVLKNEQVSAIIQRIIIDEQLHLQTLKTMLEKYSQG